MLAVGQDAGKTFGLSQTLQQSLQAHGTGDVLAKPLVRWTFEALNGHQTGPTHRCEVLGLATSELPSAETLRGAYRA